ADGSGGHPVLQRARFMAAVARDRVGAGLAFPAALSCWKLTNAHTMINRILEFSLRQRAIMLFSAVALLGAGLWSATHLPIDAVPDITGVQVQINTEVPALA